MRRTVILSLCAATLLAQDTADLFNRAPKSVDDALRARINEFYLAHVKAEFRKAELLVAEDTKDYFYNHDKPQYLGFEITHIDYSDGYTRAKATISVEERVMFPGFDGKVMKVPTASYWKLEDGKWFWYIDMEKLNQTPWGVMKAGPSTADNSPASILSTLPVDQDQLMSKIKVDKPAVTVASGQSEHVVIDNGMQGPINMSIEGKLEGIQASFDRVAIPAGEKATLTVKAADGAKSGTLMLRASPIGKAIPIQVTVR